MSSERKTSLSFKIVTSFALLIAVVLELTGSFVPFWIQTEVNATVVNGSIVRSYLGYSIWTRRICDDSKCRDRTSFEDCFHILRNNAFPFIDETANSACHTTVYFPLKSDEVGHVLIWGKKVLMPSVILGFLGFILYEVTVFMFIDCPKKNRHHVKRTSLILTTISGLGSCICVSIFCFRSPSLPHGHRISWALIMPAIGGMIQLLFSSIELYFERCNESKRQSEFDTPMKNDNKKRSARKIGFEDEPSVMHSETELIPFEI